MTDKKTPDIDLEDFPLDDTYVEKWIRNGGERKCFYPGNGLPKTTVASAPIETSAVEIFGLKSMLPEKKNSQ